MAGTTPKSVKSRKLSGGTRGTSMIQFVKVRKAEHTEPYKKARLTGAERVKGLVMGGVALGGKVLEVYCLMSSV